MKNRTCKTCEETKEITEFRHHDRPSGSWVERTCKACRCKQSVAWQKNNPKRTKEIRRRTKIKQKYGISVEDYNEMLADQNGVCAICEKPPERRKLDIDHCHDSGTVRGLLCEFCNRGLGMFRDNPEALSRAAEYLS